MFPTKSCGMATKADAIFHELKRVLGPWESFRNMHQLSLSLE